MDYRQRIIEEAAVMFRIYGIRAVTMDMLAGQMGISKRTIYEVFKDKDEILAAVLKWMAEKQKEVTAKILEESENVIEAVFRLLEMMSEHIMNMSPSFKLDMKKYQNSIIKKLKEEDQFPYYRDNEEMIRRGIKEGVFRKDIDISITNLCFQEVARISAGKDSMNSDEMTNRNVFLDFYINYLRGISTQKGLDLIDYHIKKLKSNNHNRKILI